MKFQKAELEKTIQTNRDAHRAIFEEAVEGYREKVVKELEKSIKRIKKGSVEQVYVSFPKPEDHTRDYDRLLKMLALTTEVEVELTEAQFSNYVLDDWNWKRQFLQTNSAYSMTAMARLSSNDDF